ncbi:tetratricopeptide repeat protein [candidate division KSB1 bacterium]|nr:tetratricopeptide repeat protein [candidate division KSB1 bacterium]
MKLNLKNVALVLLLVALIAGCAANTPDTNENAQTSDNENIDDLFGISKNEKSGSSGQDDEAEVLRLLGISKNENESPSATEQQPPAGDAVAQQNLQSEITTLEQQLLNKEAEIANLKSDIQAKDQRINELETDVNTQSRRPAQSAISASGDFIQDYQSALSLYQNREYKEAIAMFEDLLSRGESNSYADNCQYWIGESYYGMSNFNQAIVEFTKVFSFSSSNKNDDAQLKLGLCYWKLGDKAKAREELERLISNYPKSEYIEKAESFLARL